ncbi:MAG: group II intron reverse transcriptase/maturase [Bdellovibrionota bacterium]
MRSAKSFEISKQAVWKAWLKVKANRGGYGVDKESLDKFSGNLKDNLYKIWNRMSSGSYFPPDVLGVKIPKKSGGCRVLGVPTVGDRVAQTVVKDYLEPLLDPIFHEDSYGYRPNKSALDAISITRQRCWKYGWVLEFDIKGLFDNIDHELLMKAVKHHCQESWVLLYISRWLTVSMQTKDGERIRRKKGTPQGGVVSPILSNLFLHYVFDTWMVRNHMQTPFCRYADDGLAHCRSKEEAESLLRALHNRFEECGLELHPDKTKIVFCRRDGRHHSHKTRNFDFLGYSFKPSMVRSRQGNIFLSFVPSVNTSSIKHMISTIKKWKLHFHAGATLEDIAKRINPVLQGWANYFGAYGRSRLRVVWEHLNWRLAKWLGRKFKKMRGKRTKTIYLLGKIARTKPRLFVHWKLNCKPAAG